MTRNMLNHLTEAIHDYVSIHKLEHEEVGAVVVPFIVKKVHKTDDGELHAHAHTLIVANTEKENMLNILRGVTSQIEAGAQPFRVGPAAHTDG